jgi:hypothetical protein
MDKETRMKKCKKEWRTKEGDGIRISGFLGGGGGVREGGGEERL